MRCLLVVVTVVVMVGAASAGELGAQGVDGARAGVARQLSMDSPDGRAMIAPQADTVVVPWLAPGARPYAPLISAVVPGGGQLLLGKGRFVVYAAVEAIGWWKYQKDRGEMGQQTDAFKQMASGFARAPFAKKPQDREWAYYEQMFDWLESGSYSKSETGPVQPETNTATYNGYKWQLALQTHTTSAAALAAYEQIAIKPEFQWSWKNAQLQYDIFRQQVGKRNDAARSASFDLIAIGVNHVLSMIDAFATIRLGVQAEANGRTSVGAKIGW